LELRYEAGQPLLSKLTPDIHTCCAPRFKQRRRSASARADEVIEYSNVLRGLAAEDTTSIIATCVG
jgi:hypothetical protein